MGYMVNFQAKTLNGIRSGPWAQEIHGTDGPQNPERNPFRALGPKKSMESMESMGPMGPWGPGPS